MVLPKITVSRKSGQEPLHENGKSVGVCLIDFWQWSVSDLLNNATRGRLAEFIVATALQIPITTIRDEWSAWDLTTPDGIKVEVKSAAYCQSWHQKGLSKIFFVVPKTRAWSAETNQQDTEKRRQADIYVFALLAHKDKTTIDPLDVHHWEFYVLPTETLNQRQRSQHSITLASLSKLCQPVPYHSLYDAVHQQIDC
jgi:hypothetical protein